MQPIRMTPLIHPDLRETFQGYTERELLLLDIQKTIEIEKNLNCVKNKLGAMEKQITSNKIRIGVLYGAMVLSCMFVGVVVTVGAT